MVNSGMARPPPGKLEQQRNLARKALEKPPWLAHLGKWIAGVSVSVVLGACGLYLTYSYTGAEVLRTIYQPLYSEILANEGSMGGNLMTPQFTRATLDSLQRTGDLERVPKPLRDQMLQLYNEAASVHADAWGISVIVEAEVTRSVKLLRTEEIDKAWVQKTIRQLNEDQKTTNELSRLRTFSFPASHAWRTPAMDVRDPHNPRIVSPGGPVWQINDWIDFPWSAQQLGALWGGSFFLFFQVLDNRDTWYFRITKEDLNRKNITLEAFLAPIHRKLKGDSKFHHFAETQPQVTKSFGVVKAELAARVRQPKELVDLFER